MRLILALVNCALLIVFPMTADAQVSFGKPLSAAVPRHPVTPAELATSPYKYIGRIVNEKKVGELGEKGVGGTGVLIGPRHVLTAAHVLQKTHDSEGGLGTSTFVLANGSGESLIKDKELDAGFRHLPFALGRVDEIIKKLNPKAKPENIPDWWNPTWDIAICSLDKPLGASGHARWGISDINDVALVENQIIILPGFDHDLQESNKPPRLITRADRIRRCHLWAYVGIVPGVWAEGVGIADNNGLFYGGGALAMALLGSKGRADDDYGWEASFETKPGASGGPIWVDNGFEPIVIGVQSSMIQGKALGSRITPGACERMIRNFIDTHP